jgi:putative transposase
MFAIIFSLLCSVRQGFRTRAALQAEILALRHQLLVLQRAKRDRKLRLGVADRLLWVWLSRLWSGWRSALVIVKPETVIAWHRRGFRLYWSWKSRHPQGRPAISREVIELVRRISLANPRWGAPRVHGELLKLGFQLSEATVAKYMARPRHPSSQTWRTFLADHMKDMVSCDFFVVPTAFFRVLFVFVILSHDRRRLVHFAVTEYPTTEWVAHQLLEAFPWDSAPRYLLRDRDGSYGAKFSEATRWLGTREVLTAAQSPWQNAYVERLIGATTADASSMALSPPNASRAGLRARHAANKDTAASALIQTIVIA